MKKLVFAATIATCAAIATPALAFRALPAANRAAVDVQGNLERLERDAGRKLRLDGGPSTSDPHPPGALFLSTPDGVAKGDAQGGMVNPQFDMRKRSAAVEELRSSNVQLNTRSRTHRGTARGHHRNTVPLR
jgi:hypothetical protein